MASWPSPWEYGMPPLVELIPVLDISNTKLGLVALRMPRRTSSEHLLFE